MEEMNELIEQRFKKLDDLRSTNIDPYNGRFNPQTTAAELYAKYKDSDKDSLESHNASTSIAGRIVAMRDFGKASFAHIQDATGKIQIYLKKDVLNEKYALIKKLDIGDIIGVTGRLFRTRTNELTIEVNDFVFLSKSLRPLPEKWHGLRDIETRYRQRYVDLIVNPQVKDIFAKRSAIIKSIRDFLESHGFIEVETPMMHQIPGGAAGSGALRTAVRCVGCASCTSAQIAHTGPVVASSSSRAPCATKRTAHSPCPHWFGKPAKKESVG